MSRDEETQIEDPTVDIEDDATPELEVVTDELDAADTPTAEEEVADHDDVVAESTTSDSGTVTKPKDKPGEDDDPADWQKGRKHRSAQIRIDKAVAKQRQSERERDEALDKVRKLEEERQTLLTKANPPKSDDQLLSEIEKEVGAKPKYDDCDGPDDFDAKTDEWRRKRDGLLSQKKETQEKPKPAVKPEEEVRREQYGRFVQRVETIKKDGAELYDDYEKVVYDDSVNFTPQMVGVIAGLENAPDVFYYLAKHPDEVTRIGSMDPKDVSGAIALVNTTVTEQVMPEADDSANSSGNDDPAKAVNSEPGKTATRPVTTTTKAKPPIKPVRSGTRTTASKDPSKMSPREYQAWRSAGGGR